jgi:hydroxyacylglutathione hydrolase
VLLYCAGGWRSSVAASLLRAKGFSDVSDILGGYWSTAHQVQPVACAATARAEAAQQV